MSRRRLRGGTGGCLRRMQHRFDEAWQEREDSNPRPPVLETGALTKLSYAPTWCSRPGHTQDFCVGGRTCRGHYTAKARGSAALKTIAKVLLIFSEAVQVALSFAKPRTIPAAPLSHMVQHPGIHSPPGYFRRSSSKRSSNRRRVA